MGISVPFTSTSRVAARESGRVEGVGPLVVGDDDDDARALVGGLDRLLENGDGSSESSGSGTSCTCECACCVALGDCDTPQQMDADSATECAP